MIGVMQQTQTPKMAYFAGAGAGALGALGVVVLWLPASHAYTLMPNEKPTVMQTANKIFFILMLL
jgi:hypothetical protein